MNRIFEPYFTTRGDKGGSGLGMSVVFGIVKGHGGYIDVKSTPGEGTEINVFFPASMKREELLYKETVESSGGTETLLIIDDEEAILKMAKTILEESGFNIYTTTSGKKGIETFKENDIDLVILDIKMPEMDGKEVLKKLMEVDPEVKILLSSGYSEEDEHHDLLRMGAKGFIGKPFVIDKLLIKIHEVLT
jgi:CheY-like chemotaxis protein